MFVIIRFEIRINLFNNSAVVGCGLFFFCNQQRKFTAKAIFRLNGLFRLKHFD